MACKFGARKAVEVLLSYPNCHSENLNKFEKRPRDVICERKGDASTKAIISELLERRLYVPLIRTDVQIIIGSPSMTPNSESDALAGPMSPDEAKKLTEELKSPIGKGSNNQRLSNYYKGAEQVARSLCHKMGVRFKEKWPFFQEAVDLSTLEGLAKLESHFRDLLSVRRFFMMHNAR